MKKYTREIIAAVVTLIALLSIAYPALAQVFPVLPMTLTTNGTSGAATFSNNVLNIPIYSGSGGGGSGLATTSPWISGQLAQVVNNGIVISIATSSLGLLTTNVAEGSNLYFTTARATANFISNLAATTSIASITTLPSLSLPLSQTTGILSVANGGTGSTTLSGILIGNGTSALNTLTVGSGLTLTGTTLSASGSSITGTQGQDVYIGPAGTAVATSTIFISSNGSTGIGTTTYSGVGTAALTLVGNSAINSNDTSLAIVPVSASGQSKINFQDSNDNSKYSIGYRTNDATFDISQAGGLNSGQILTINASGFVGIGTTSPWAWLSVGQASTTPSFVVGVAGSSTPSFLINSANNNGSVSIGQNLLLGEPAGQTATTSGSALTLSSIASVNGITLYNTADQSTNFERGNIMWTGNQFQVLTSAGGTGTVRSLKIGVANAAAVIANNGSLGGQLDFNGFTTSTAGAFGYEFGLFNTTAASGISTVAEVIPTINESSTAGYTAWQIEPTETALGSGAKLLLQVGTTTNPNLFDVTNLGVASSTGLNITGNELVTGNVTWPSFTGTQCLHEVNGLVGVTGSDCSSGGYSPIGTTGQFPYFSASNTLTATSSIFLTSNQFLGIGTTSPASQLEVDGMLTIQGTPGATNANFILQSGDYIGKWSVLTNAGSGTFSIYDYLDNITPFNIQKHTPSNTLNLNSNGTAAFAGNITIATTTATSTLSTGGFTIGTNQFLVQQTSGSVGIGTTTPGSILSIQNVANFVASGVSTIYNGLSIIGNLFLPSLGTPAGKFLAVTPTGQVIGTTTPVSGVTTTGTFATSTNAAMYAVVSVPAGETVDAWGVCGSNDTVSGTGPVQFFYRWASDNATTTTPSVGNNSALPQDLSSDNWSVTATSTSNTLTIEFSAGKCPELNNLITQTF